MTRKNCGVRSAECGMGTLLHRSITPFFIFLSIQPLLALGPIRGGSSASLPSMGSEKTLTNTGSSLTAMTAALPHVADANARLSLDPTGKVAGYQVIQDDNSTTYTLQDVADDKPGLWVTGAGTADVDGPYTFNGTDTYTQIGGAGHTVTGSGGSPWTFNSDTVYVGDATTYAWQVVTWTLGSIGVDPVPVVARNPIAGLANWTPNP